MPNTSRTSDIAEEEAGGLLRKLSERLLSDAEVYDAWEHHDQTIKLRSHDAQSYITTRVLLPRFSTMIP